MADANQGLRSVLVVRYEDSPAIEQVRVVYTDDKGEQWDLDHVEQSAVVLAGTVGSYFYWFRRPPE